MHPDVLEFVRRQKEEEKANERKGGVEFSADVPVNESQQKRGVGGTVADALVGALAGFSGGPQAALAIRNQRDAREAAVTDRIEKAKEFVARQNELKEARASRLDEAEKDRQSRETLARENREAMAGYREEARADRLAAAEEARNERKAARDAAATNKHLSLEEKESQWKERQTKDYRDKLQSSDPYKNWTTLKQARVGIEAATKDPSAFGDVSTIYGFVKSLDPNSAVREGEIHLMGVAASVKSRLQRAVNRMASGQQLTAEQRADILKWAKQREQTARTILKQHSAPTFEQSDRLGLNRTDILDIGPDDPVDEAQQQMPVQPYEDKEKEARYQAWKKANGK